MTAAERKVLQDLVAAYAYLANTFCKNPMLEPAYARAVAATLSAPWSVRRASGRLSTSRGGTPPLRAM